MRSMGRPQAWTTAGLWAVDRLEEHLGRDWPERTWQRFGRLPAGIELAPMHTIAFAELLELALRLDRCRDCERLPRVIRTLITNANEDEVVHLRMQLELAALALHAGHGVAFEPSVTGGRRRADLELDLTSGRQTLVETRAILMPERLRTAHGFADDVFDAVRAIGHRHGVECEGEFTRVLDEHETSVLLSELDRYALLIAKGIAMPPFRAHGAFLTMRPGSGIGGGLKGPASEGDIWPRLAARLQEKAEQTRGVDRVWLRIDARQGLWQFTAWAKEDLAAKLVLLQHNVASVLGEHPHVAGVVMTPGAVLTQGMFADEDHEGPEGFALRRLIAPLRVRETLIMPLDAYQDTTDLAHAWRDLYASEPRWLDHALQVVGLPSADDVFAAAQPEDT